MEHAKPQGQASPYEPVDVTFELHYFAGKDEIMYISASSEDQYL